jgi:4-hydroxy-3-methylbut-2-en-1-yl diphosphate synthase IspG/GcpE
MLLSSRSVTVGKTMLGSAHPVAKQTMTTTVTRDVASSVEQVRHSIHPYTN